ncbi:MAG: [LysW]-lysine hydrolase [Chloroflexota bacterium]
MTDAATTTIPVETAEQLLHDLVAMPSLSYNEAGAVRLLVDWMSSHGYDDAFVDEAGNAIGIVGSGDGSRDIVLLGHIDTFPGAPPVYIDGRNLYGRGSVDAKGPLCTFAVAAANARASLPEGVRIIVTGAVEEEAPTSAGARHISTQYKPQACVIGEPSHWDRITLGYKGRLLLNWHWEGDYAHSAADVPTAGERAYMYWERVQRYLKDVNGDSTSIFWRLDASIREINTGTSHHGTHQWGEMNVGFRLPPELQPEDIEIALQSEDPEETVTTFGRERTFVSGKSTSISRAMRGAIRKEGGTPRFVYKTGTSDMNAVGPRWNCPIIAYGPGDSTLDHTPHEHIDLDEYGQAVKVLTRALERLANEI